MNHSLSILKAYIEAFESGQFPLWSDSIFGGYSLVSIPFQFPNPVALIGALAGIKDVYQFAGYEAIILLALSGWFAYEFLIASGRTQLASIVGGILYQTCNLTLLKNAQNDMSFAVLVLAPLLLLQIKKINQKLSYASYFSIAAISFFLFNFTFIQKIGYLTLLGFAYAFWLAFQKKNFRGFGFCLLAALPGVFASIPRIVTIGQDFLDSNRFESSPINSHVFMGQHLPWFEILRWFDARILGSSWDELSKLGNGTNLSEGFLLYMGLFSAILIIYALASRLPWKLKDNDAKFASYVLIFSFLVVFTSPGYELIYQLFGKIGFIHYRILLICILPSCILVSLSLDALNKPLTNTASSNNLTYLKFNFLNARPWISICFTVLIIIAIELIAFYGNGSILRPITISPNWLTLQGGATFRIIASLLFVVFLLYYWKKHLLSSNVLRLMLATALLLQGILYAISFIWGPDRWHDVTAFKKPSISMAHKGEFLPPSQALLRNIENRLETKSYRISFICNPKDVAINCSTRIASNLHLRSIDGYLNSTPSRLAALNLMPSAQVRSITYSNPNELDWALLGLLNTKYALHFQPGLFTNSIKLPNGQFRELQIDDLKIEENPLPVTPRVFFAKSIVPAKDLNEALALLKPGGKSRSPGYYPEITSIAEGANSGAEFSTKGTITPVFQSSKVVVNLSPSEEKRFLVLNERFTNDWVAIDEKGNKLHIYPTNIFMRGIVIEPQIKKIEFLYKPPATNYYITVTLGLLTLIIGVLILRRYSALRLTNL
ncbi:hypothetical protein [Polynucleobacter sp. IMCC 29146]|uniref:hypothetical protein n=1 Tax=Polynucleobacter sp. IMCC 29146 TaxID=2780953 RepID=UPI001F353ADF|nr:hypothetical protein [Polynucleobacter sp. IMCC 29146]MCE7530650.1 hypothetical protein [Polynucleobacter sp. IMCC 29146]